MKRQRTMRFVAFGSLLLGLTQCNWLADMSQGEFLKDPRCVVESCDLTSCEIEVLRGKILEESEQVEGDCVTAICNDTGQVELVPNADDLPIDGNPCTSDECQGPFPLHELLATGRCYTGPPGTEGVGKCRAGAVDCQLFGSSSECVGEVLPTEEVCDVLHVDDDCDGKIDEEDGPGCYCGDGFVQDDAGEACDDGNSAEDDTCRSDCTPAECGDGIVQRAADENCDDGNTVDGDECPADCRIGIMALATGSNHSCALFANNVLKCWGGSFQGQLGLGTRFTRGILPQQMGQYLPAVDLGMPGIPIIQLAAGSGHTCALFEGGTIKCWGSNSLGQLGLGDTEHRGDDPGEMGQALPAVDLGTGVIAAAVTAGGGHTCALLTDGQVKCWGQFFGVGSGVPHGAFPNSMGDNLPVVDLGANALAISAGGAHTCALFDKGRIKCWGDNTRGQLGLGDRISRGPDPTQMGTNLFFVNLGTGKRVIAVHGGGAHTCALLEGGSVKCWGSNDAGQLGLGITIYNMEQIIGGAPGQMGDALPTVDLGPDAAAIALDTGWNHTCATLSDHSLKCWGFNQYGLLGLGDELPRGSEPEHMGQNLPTVQLGTGAEVNLVSAGWQITCAWLVGDRIKCWGIGGILGLGDIENRGDGPDEMGDALPFVEPL